MSVKRESIPSHYKWKLENICKSQAEWHDRDNRLQAAISRFSEINHPPKSAEHLQQLLEDFFEMEEESNRLFVYARMKHDEDTANNENKALLDLASSRQAEFLSVTVKTRSNILKLGEIAIAEYLDAIPHLKLYHNHLTNLFRTKKHVLSAEVETALAAVSEINETASNIFNMFLDADIKFDTIKDENGNQVELTHAKYIALLKSPNREVRKNAFFAYAKEWMKLKNTLATAYSCSVKKDVKLAKLRNHKSAMASALV